jgi:RNA polymerase sigma factor (TIGR02999 family)
MNTADRRAAPAPPPPSDLTRVLDRFRAGDARAAEELLPLAYAELRRLAARQMAGERPGHTLQATALVHEAWLRLGADAQPAWQNRAHFFHAAAEAMRRILVESARRKLAAKRGGAQPHLDANEIEIPSPVPDEELLAVHEALDALAQSDAAAAELVRLRYFAGLDMAAAAAALNLPQRSAERLWTYARAWLAREIKRSRADARHSQALKVFR